MSDKPATDVKPRPTFPMTFPVVFGPAPTDKPEVKR